jgi:calcineurin-like phosphoesterase family protein
MTFNPETLFFTSDTHFGHGAVIGFGRRPFNDRDEMDAEMIRMWNEVVPTNGVVIHLGDVSFRGTAETTAILGQLNGRLLLVPGNHDRGMSKVPRSIFSEILAPIHKLKLLGHRIILSHFPLESWEDMGYGSWHLHGHTHGSLPGFGRRLDVGMDALKFWHPISFRAIEARMLKTQPQTRDYHVYRGER